ncbi:effector binding domain-containing protein [Haliscomenobacter sp.]|uniref:effector binding domain-containing protein n=1 Tax=Haliscomenobacter sp. TaxID=2717303 RepID=UPI0033651CE4
MKIFLTLILGVLSYHAMAQQLLSPSEMQKDVAILKEALTKLHPGLYKYNTPAQMGANFKELETLAAKPLDLQKFYLTLAEFATKIKCGHTFLNPLNLDDAVAAQLFSNQVVPFYFKIIDDKIILTHNVSNVQSMAAGDEILQIGVASTKQIVEKLLQVSRADGNNAMGKKRCNIGLRPEEDYGNSLFDIFYPLYFPMDKALKIQVKTPKKNIKTLEIETITAVERKARYESSHGAIPENEQTWAYKNLKPNVAYLKFGTFAFWNSDFAWKKYIDSVFTKINADKKLQNMVIDLRGNEGGSGEIRDYILSKITQKPLLNEQNSAICYRYLTVPDSLKKHLSTWDRSFKAPKNPAEFTLNELGLYQKNSTDEEKPIQASQGNYKGNVYLLVDPVCSSATFGFAWTFQYNKLGKIVGETTGGTKQGLNGAEMFFLTLPNSKIEMDLPLIYFYTKNVPDEGVKPDFEVTMTSKDIMLGRDAQLEAVLKMIKKPLKSKSHTAVTITKDMEFEEMKLAKRYVVGISVRTTNQNGQSQVDIGELWGKFYAQNVLATIPNRVSDDVYCVYTDYESDQNAPFTSIIGCEVSSVKEIPSGMMLKKIPASKYRVYTAKGKLPDCVVGTWMHIWGSPIDRKYAADFDVYGVKSKDPMDAEVKTYLSVK